MRVSRKHHQNRTPSGLHGAGGVCLSGGTPRRGHAELTESREGEASVSFGKFAMTAPPKNKSATSLEKFFFCLTGPYLTRRATIGRLEPPLGRGRIVCDPPTCHPHKYNGQYGPGFIELMTPGDTPPPPDPSNPPFP